MDKKCIILGHVMHGRNIKTTLTSHAATSGAADIDEGDCTASARATSCASSEQRDAAMAVAHAPGHKGGAESRSLGLICRPAVKPTQPRARRVS